MIFFTFVAWGMLGSKIVYFAFAMGKPFGTFSADISEYDIALYIYPEEKKTTTLLRYLFFLGTLIEALRHPVAMTVARLYDRLRSADLGAKGDNFFNMSKGLDGPISRAEPGVYSQAVDWDDLTCDDVRTVGQRFEVRTHCRGGASRLGQYKFFVRLTRTDASSRRRLLRNLHDYARHVQKNHISRTEHMELFKLIERRRRSLERRLGQRIVAINDNREVPLLHFKFVARAPTQTPDERRHR